MVKNVVRPTPDNAVATTLSASGMPATQRNALAALFALDRTLGQVLRTTREPLLGQMRLVWWHDALERLDTEPPPAEPMLEAVAANLLPADVSGSSLAAMIEGWEALLETRLDRDALDRHARDRGARLFGIAAGILGSSEPADQIAAAGMAWALADLAANISDATTGAEAREMARTNMRALTGQSWRARARPLGALVLPAVPALWRSGHGMRDWLMISRFRLTGRWPARWPVGDVVRTSRSKPERDTLS